MENKSLFAAISLTIVLISGFFFYNNQVSQLENEITSITTEYNSKINAVQPVASTENNVETSILEDLNNQLIDARSALQAAQKKLTLATSKSSVLNDEIVQIHDARVEVKTLKGSLQHTKNSLQTTQEELNTSDKKINYLEGLFKSQNKATVAKNIARIHELKDASTGIVVTGLIVPAFGVATLISYTTQEIDNYCANIKNTMDLEKKVFNKVVSLDAQMQENYHQQCEVSLKDKVKKGLKKLQTAKK
jgi:predicted PurR-regulated permease PerM